MNYVHLCGGWVTNIGNAFIDVGAESIFKQLETKFNYITFEGSIKSYFANSNIDIIEMSGACLTENLLLEEHLSFFDKIHERNPEVKIIFNGVGGWLYCEDEADAVRKFVDRYNVSLVITRDYETYNYLRDYTDCYMGVDCAFFISDLYKYAPLFDIPYSILVETDHDTQYSPIKTSHIYSSVSTVFSSDRPQGYFHLYSGAKEIYSSRIHGAILAGSYRVPCQLVLDLGPRASLFEAAGYSVRERLAIPNNEILNKRKNYHLSILKDYITRWEAKK